MPSAHEYINIASVLFGASVASIGFLIYVLFNLVRDTRKTRRR